MKSFRIFALSLCVLMCFSFCSCYYSTQDNTDYPRHRYENSAELKKALPSGVFLPDIKKTGLSGETNYYTVTLPKKITTGYSVEIKSDKEGIIGTAELRGIKTSIKDRRPEGFCKEDYTEIIGKTDVKIGERDCKYAAYTDKVYSEIEQYQPKGSEAASSKVPTDNLNIKYFYIYTESDGILYSITFSDFSVGTINEDICDACLKNSKGFFENIKKA